MHHVAFSGDPDPVDLRVIPVDELRKVRLPGMPEVVGKYLVEKLPEIEESQAAVTPRQYWASQSNA
jgi:hypothetical protein